ncbi:hypothetical protein Tco_1076648, partial [Tanacetum coccineum]
MIFRYLGSNSLTRVILSNIITPQLLGLSILTVLTIDAEITHEIPCRDAEILAAVSQESDSGTKAVDATEDHK